MAQTDSHNITVAPIASTRRRFLSTAAGAAAGGAALALATTSPVSAAAAPASPLAATANASAVSADPVFAAIEAHKAVSAALEAVVRAHSDLEAELPRDKRRSTVDIWDGEKIVETDDTRWIESERESMRMWGAEDDAAGALLSIQPTTPAGIVALLRYAVGADIDGETWPRELVSDDGRTRSWHHFLIESLVEVLPAIVGAV